MWQWQFSQLSLLCQIQYCEGRSDWYAHLGDFLCYWKQTLSNDQINDKLSDENKSGALVASGIGLQYGNSVWIKPRTLAGMQPSIWH